MLMLPKRLEFDDADYRDYLHSLNCFVTNRPGPVIAHLRLGGTGGISKKPMLYDANPLIQQEHDLQHRLGEVKYWRDVMAVSRPVLTESLQAVGRLRCVTWLHREGRTQEALVFLAEWGMK